jgi:hypothetical protein
VRDLLVGIEREIQEISSKTKGTLRLIASTDPMPGPALYQEVIRNFTWLHEAWRNHRENLSQALPLIAHRDPHLALFLDDLEEDGASLEQQLGARSSAGWPRKPEIGLTSIRLGGRETLTSLLRQLESERTTVVPLLRRALSPVPASSDRQLASA